MPFVAGVIGKGLDLSHSAERCPNNQDRLLMLNITEGEVSL